MSIKEKIRQLALQERAKRLVSQFAAPSALLLCFNIWILLLINDIQPSEESTMLGIAVFFVLSSIWTTGMQLSPLRINLQKTPDELVKPLLVQILGVLAIAGESIYLALFATGMQPASTMAHVAVIFTAIMALFLYLFRHHGDDRQLIRWTADLMLAQLLAGFCAWFVTGAMETLLFGIQELFGINVNERLFGSVAATCLILIAGGVTLLFMPEPDSESTHSPLSIRLCDKLGRFMLLPVSAVYLVVLYVYILKIVVAWQLPNGMVTWLTTALMALVLGTVTLLYRTLFIEENVRWKTILQWCLPLSVIPVLILMTTGIARRVSDYGWTPMRGYVVVVLLWFFASVAILLWGAYQHKKGRQPHIIRWLIASFALLLTFSSAIPELNVISVCTKLQRSEEPTEPKTWAETHQTTFNFYRSDNQPIAIPEGYHTFSPISEYDHKAAEPQRDKQGRLTLEFKEQTGKRITVYFDDAHNWTDYVDLPTSDDKLIRAYNFTVVDNEGKLYINSLNGYLFSK
ncbi:MAG: DUF4153 domain-containing protein [Bacteroidales bacterium]|nr:DUF4153 domain-containing protein [Candidatus Colicola faecequi]